MPAETQISSRSSASGRCSRTFCERLRIRNPTTMLGMKYSVPAARNAANTAFARLNFIASNATGSIAAPASKSAVLAPRYLAPASGL